MGCTMDLDVKPDSVVVVSRHRVGWMDDTCKATVRNSITRRRAGSVGGAVAVVPVPLSRACKQ